MGYRYLLGGTLVESSTPLPAVECTHEPGLRVVRYYEDNREPLTGVPIPLMGEDKPHLFLVKSETHYELRYGDGIRFFVSCDGSEVAYMRELRTQREEVHSYFLEDALPRLRRLHGAITLHASGAVLPDGVAAFVARSGAGKSTLAAAISLNVQAVFDDSLGARIVDERVFCEPQQGASRLWEDSLDALRSTTEGEATVSLRNGKNLVKLTNGATHSARLPLRQIYVIDREADRPSIVPLSAKAAFEGVLAHVFRLDPTDREQLAEEMRFVARIAETIPVARLCYPRDYSVLPEVVELVLADIRSRNVVSRMP